eukprot:CAMPEP_0202919778 /NCGR_PEP_ID=MMETSP1392-20130828/76509_1 /ASSEMBLY_ACC=CAM_ASM_000868 /TAXON_ID=225041 /ORGANISM="Chlamydomonas chlamydogama, Strain SAG 11-48b" /LENGTH=147 /DNA_ID=CAMNT_0049613237 /DNA_START=147 /DNA_END=590 /DNA_ORIENTATION=+
MMQMKLQRPANAVTVLSRGGSRSVALMVRPSHHKHARLVLVQAAPQPDTEEARSPLDAPQEWEAPMPSKRPDIFPEFEKMERVFLPKPLPGDPEMPDEESEEAAKRTTPGDPDPEQKPGEVPEEPEQPAQPGSPEPEKKTDIPSIPE